MITRTGMTTGTGTGMGTVMPTIMTMDHGQATTIRRMSSIFILTRTAIRGANMPRN